MDKILRLSISSCTLGAMLGLPLLQGFIWYTGISLSQDLLNQFSWDGTNRESWKDFLMISFFFGGIGQMIVGLIIGFLTGWAASLKGYWRQSVLPLVGAIGSVIFGFLLWKSWSFNGNHCGPDGCDATSPFAFDFVQSVFLACPLLWCLGTLFFGMMMRAE